MSMLSLRAPQVPRVWSSFARIGAAIVTMLDVLAEARLRELAAHNRLPFSDW